MLLSKRDGTFGVLQIESSNPALEVSPQTLKGGSLYRLTLVWRREAVESAAETMITVHTDNRDPASRFPCERPDRGGRHQRRHGRRTERLWRMVGASRLPG